MDLWGDRSGGHLAQTRLMSASRLAGCRSAIEEGRKNYVDCAVTAHSGHDNQVSGLLSRMPCVPQVSSAAGVKPGARAGPPCAADEIVCRPIRRARGIAMHREGDVGEQGMAGFGRDATAR